MRLELWWSSCGETRFHALDGVMRLTEQRAISSKWSADGIGVMEGIAGSGKQSISDERGHEVLR